MNELKLALTSGTQIVIAEFSLPCHIVIACADKEDMQTIWGLLSDEELVDAAIYQGDNRILNISNASVVGTQTVSNTDGSLTAHFYLDGEVASAADSEYADAAKILLGEEE